MESQEKNGMTVKRNKMHVFDNRPNEFMNNKIWRKAIHDIIETLLTDITLRQEIDTVYQKLCTSIVDEMDKYLSIKGSSKNVRKRFKHNKPY